MKSSIHSSTKRFFKSRKHLLLLGSLSALVIACSSSAIHTASKAKRTPQDETSSYMDLNPVAANTVLYELQVRSANACDPNLGTDWQKDQCKNKMAPKVVYRAQGMSCGMIDSLHSIKLGTLDDLMKDTDDYENAISLRYIHDRVGANMVWLMPLFPNNDTWNIPDACDDLGSPYAVRDYMHVSGMLSNDCIAQGKDEHDSDSPCWGTKKLQDAIVQAHGKGMKIMLDVAFNHFGHNYQMYDYAQYKPIRDRLFQGYDGGDLWDFAATREDDLINPVILDTPKALADLAATNSYHKNNLAGLQAKCPNLQGQALVRAYHMWSNALDWERGQFQCTDTTLEFQDPGFYLGANAKDPSTGVGNNFTNNWQDVKFLYHHEENKNHTYEFIRNREYLFRIVNYWVSLGVDGFRFDHTTDPDGGMGPNEWKYILSKVDYYANLRNQGKPVYLAEEFGDQMGMSHVVDVMTEGYVGNMCGRNNPNKDANFVENVLQNNDRFGGHTFVMTALETHDETRLVNGTGFNRWTGAGFWGLGATVWSTPMILMGQEFGESWGLGFRRSDMLRSRFVGTDNFQSDGYKLIDFYHSLISARLNDSNGALRSDHREFLRPLNWTSADPSIFAEAKVGLGGNVMFIFHNLWQNNVAQKYTIDDDMGKRLAINDDTQYQLTDAISGVTMPGDCRSGRDIRSNLGAIMGSGTLAQWLRLELCNH